MKLLTCLMCIFLISISPNAQTRFANRLNIGKADSIYSAALKEKRFYLVYTPPSYRDSAFNATKYPVLYLLDGDAHFHSVSGLVQFLSTGAVGNYVIPEMIIIAITNTDRIRDLTPTNIYNGPNGKVNPAMKNSGGMNNFFTFLKNELIPHIDSGYRTSGYRMLIGHSFGGIAVINALYTMPGMFDAYVSIDPAIWFDNDLLVNKAKDYFRTTDLKNKFLYLAQANTLIPNDTGKNVHFESMKRFNSIIKSNNKSGLNYQYKYYPDDDHSSIPLIAEYDALRFIFNTYRTNFFSADQSAKSISDHFANFSSRMGKKFDPPGRMINTLGFLFLTEFYNTAKAVEFFQLNVDLYPSSAKAWDSLGEGFMIKGDIDKAISSYQRSLELDPGNINAIAKIKELRERK